MRLPGGQTAQFPVTDIRGGQYRDSDLLLTRFRQRILNHAVQHPTVLIQMRDNQRLLPGFRRSAGIVADNGLIQRHGHIRKGFALFLRLLCGFRQFPLLQTAELRHRVFRRPCPLQAGNLNRLHVFKPGQCLIHIPVNQAVHGVPQFRCLAYNLLHDGHISRAARLLQAERLAGCDGLQLVRVTARHGTTTTGRNQGVCPRHIGVAHHRTLIKEEQRVAEIRRFTAALLQLRVVQKGRQRLCFHAGTAHLPDRPVGRSQPHDAGTLTLRQQVHR
ncbi:Uncharacterised protein [Salmonella enterica subsp. enterica serovar Typhimurium str. DT104]|nr:Uncharacterised protein [Salmonella enterica subsp. enterica serovar Typhimurium str. DT104]CQF13827.1 Uncharacterised protein [Salmonella enterica subsp. enterica serovar Typhimurium str. DT104]CQN09400.1 Uncharacterised protein [Salmonella enterica subsp. enterica serovar Typhimurium str. DT104]